MKANIETSSIKNNSDEISLCIILPAYNEAKVIKTVLETIQHYTVGHLNHFKTDIVVVNDGSTDKTSNIAKACSVKVINHIINRGLGGALATGLDYAKHKKADIALTMDSDGQHKCTDIIKAIKPIIEGEADVVIGSRLLGQRGMPLERIIVNFLGNVVTWLLFRVWTTDSQSGFRVFNNKALNLINLKTQGMEVSSEFFTEIRRHRLRYAEVPIEVIYTDYSRQKGQSSLNSINIMSKLLLRLFR